MAMTEQIIVSKKEYAEYRGISPAAVTKAINDGRITVLECGRLDRDQADLEWSTNSRGRVDSKPKQSAEVLAALLSARERKETANAEKAEMETASMRGDYLLKNEVLSEFYAAARAMRDGLMNCSKRISAQVAACQSTAECEEIIDAEHRQLLENFVAILKAKFDSGVSDEVASNV